MTSAKFWDSDSVGTAKKCHCKRNDDFQYKEIPFWTTKTVTVAGVTVTYMACTDLQSQSMDPLTVIVTPPISLLNRQTQIRHKTRK